MVRGQASSRFSVQVNWAGYVVDLHIFVWVVGFYPYPIIYDGASVLHLHVSQLPYG